MSEPEIRWADLGPGVAHWFAAEAAIGVAEMHRGQALVEAMQAKGWQYVRSFHDVKPDGRTLRTYPNTRLIYVPDLGGPVWSLYAPPT